MNGVVLVLNQNYEPLNVTNLPRAFRLIFGLKAYVLIQLTVMMVAGAAGVWLFYVQHQFEEAYWERGEDWDYVAAALRPYVRAAAALRSLGLFAALALLLGAGVTRLSGEAILRK